MTYTIYHNPRCSKSRQTLEILQVQGIEPKIIEYLKDSVSKDEISSLCKMLGMTPLELIRKKEKIIIENSINIDTDEAALIAMSEYPVLLERPIVIAGDKAILGRPPESVKALF